MTNEHPESLPQTTNRRLFLKSALAAGAAAAFGSLSCTGERSRPQPQSPLRFGVLTDCHYAEVDPSGGRYYRQSADKLTACVADMNAQHVDFLIEIGDFKDQDPHPSEATSLKYLDKIESIFRTFNGPIYHALGNHDMDSLSKVQVLSRIRNTGLEPARAYYSFDVKGTHLVVLDANYKTGGAEYDRGNFTWNDANIPAQELEWLKKDLADAKGPVIAFVHQMLDGVRQETVRNAAEVRTILEASNKVVAVFQGHLHSGAYSQIAGIHYYTLPGVIEGDGPANNSYAIVQVQADGSLTITGYHKAPSRDLARQAPAPVNG
jgi:hypothetical protein